MNGLPSRSMHRRRSPASLVDDLVGGPTAPRGGPAAAGLAVGRVAEGDRTEQLESGRNAEGGTQLGLAARTRRTTTHRVRRPRRRGAASSPPSPCRSSSTAPAMTRSNRRVPWRLVRLGVAIQVRLRVGQRQGDHRRVEEAGEGEPESLVSRERDVPESRRFVAGQHDEVPTLGLAGARRPRCEIDEVVEQLERDWIAAERPGHPPPADDWQRAAPTVLAQVRAPSLTRSSAIVQP